MQAVGHRAGQWKRRTPVRSVRLRWSVGTLLCCLLLGLLGGGGTAATGQPAEPAPLTLDPMVVTATVAPTPLRQSSASVTVIDRRQIEAQQASSVIELLRHVPGVHIDQAGGRGSVSSVYIRGGDPNFTVVLLDGVKVNDPTNSRGGSFDFSTLSTENIERIEIVRGPLSAVYGSDALSGAINIITRQGTSKASQRVELAGGRYAYWRTVAEAQGKIGILDYATSGSAMDNGEPTEGSAFKNTAFQANIGLAPAQKMQLRAIARYSDTESEAYPEASGGPEFAVLRAVDTRDSQELTLGFTLMHEPLPWWEYHVQLGILNWQEDLTSPGVAPNGQDFRPPSQTETTFWRYDVTMRHMFAVFKGVRLAMGAQVQIEDGTSTGSLDFGGFAVPTSFELSRTTWAPFFEVQLVPFPGLLVQGGVRIDIPEGFDTEVSPRVGASYTIASTGTTLRANWGEGFKLPSFYALGSPPPVGNPQLLPETSRSFDVGLSQSLWQKRATIGATYFVNRFHHLIDFDFATFQLVNRTAVDTEGVELNVRVQPWPILGFTAHATYVTTDIQGSSATLRNRPEWRGGFAIEGRPWRALVVRLQALFVGQAHDASVPTGNVTLDAYSRVDLAVNWTISATWLAFLTVDNLFDARYEEFVGFTAPGINPRLGVQARF